MIDQQTPAADHKDNLLGVCAALGEDFGFNPLWLRLALAVGFLFSAEWVTLGYLTVGAVVLVSRLLYPNRKRAVVTAPDAALVSPAATADSLEEIEYARAA